MNHISKKNILPQEYSTIEIPPINEKKNESEIDNQKEPTEINISESSNDKPIKKKRGKINKTSFK